jgi:hypothetical protein
MELTIDLVPYKLEQHGPNEVVMHSDYYAKILTVKSRFTEKFAGFPLGKRFVHVDADMSLGTVTFTAPDITLDDLADLFSIYIDGIVDLGYESMFPVPV